MKPNRCTFCKGTLVKGKTEFLAKVGNEVVSIKDVSALICNQCGEAYYDPDVSRKIDTVMKKFHKKRLLAHPIAAGELSISEIPERR